MKALRRFFTVTALTIVLAHAALGEEGVIHPGSTDSGTELDGEEATIDLAMEMTLTLVQNLLALF